MSTDNDTPEEGDPLVRRILDMVRQAKSVHPRDIAIAHQQAHPRKKDGADAWRRYMVPIRQQAVSMARKGELLILRKGKPVDPNDFKGVYRLAAPSKDVDSAG